MISEHICGGLVDKSFQQRKQMWLVLTEESSGVGARSHGPDFHSWMRKQQPEQLSACITCSTRYRDPRNHSHEYAISSNFMHLECQGLVIDRWPEQRRSASRRSNSLLCRLRLPPRADRLF